MNPTPLPDPTALDTEEMPPFDPELVLDSDAAILRTLSSLIGLEDRRWPALWFLLLTADRHPWPVLMPLEGLPSDPRPAELDDVLAAAAAMLREVTPGGALVLALVHPRGGTVEPFDRLWSAELRAAARRAEVPLRAVLTAGRRGTAVLPPDRPLAAA